MKLYNVVEMFETFCCQTATRIAFVYFSKDKAIKAGKRLAMSEKIPFYEECQSGFDNQVFIKEFETSDEPEIKDAK